MTEHAAVIFVFFFLAEYASIVFMCILISILYVGGFSINQNIIYYLSYLDISELLTLIRMIVNDTINALTSFVVSTIYSIWNFEVIDINTKIMSKDAVFPGQFNDNIDYFLTSSTKGNILFPFILGFKTAIFIFIFIWVRASFPRIRFDQLMSFCWTVLLPLVFAFIILVPCVTYVNIMFPVNTLFF